jgi:hypothetical protein
MKMNAKEKLDFRFKLKQIVKFVLFTFYYKTKEVHANHPFVGYLWPVPHDERGN